MDILQRKSQDICCQLERGIKRWNEWLIDRAKDDLIAFLSLVVPRLGSITERTNRSMARNLPSVPDILIPLTRNFAAGPPGPPILRQSFFSDPQPALNDRQGIGQCSLAKPHLHDTLFRSPHFACEINTGNTALTNSNFFANL